MAGADGGGGDVRGGVLSMVTAADGTRLRAWRSPAAEGPRPAVLLSNGLGTVPGSWPGLTAADSGWDVVTWYHRGTFGTPRPADRSRVRVEDHVADAVAVLDAAGVERALVACWSIGVNVGFALAELHPERVAGLLAVAGVPGGTFATMGEPWRVPRRLRRPVATAVTRSLRLVGPALTKVARAVPKGRPTAQVVRALGLVDRGVDPDVLAPVLAEFLEQDWRWYMHLALGAAEHAAMDLAFVRCPVTLLGARSDLLTSVHDVVATGDRLRAAGVDVEVTVVPGTHFLPLERPDLVQVALTELARRAGG